MSLHVLNSLVIRPILTPVAAGVTCLLVETNQGPVLVDAGLGRKDHLDPAVRTRLYHWFFRASRGIEGTAYQLVQNLGYQPETIRHIVISHLHLDHTGGLPDFPWAEVHLYRKEYDYAMHSRNLRYLPEHWAHGPLWRPHKWTGEKWFDFEAIPLKGFEPEIWLIPLEGHSPGHAGVAIQDGVGWVLYAGDAIPYHARVDLVPRWFARFFMYRHAPRIREFIKAHPEVRLVGGHMDYKFYENR